MSMYQIEDFIENTVRTVATSALDIQQKRNLIHTLFEMESYGDCSFTNLRTINEMIACSYSFTFDANQMYNYDTYPELYTEDADTEKDLGSVYFDEETNKFCMDSGSDAWIEMVRIGAVSGEGAIPVEMLPFKEVFKQIKSLMPNMDRYTRQGFIMLAMITGIMDEMSDEECLNILGMSKEQIEDGEEDNFEPQTETKSDRYEMCGHSITFDTMAEVDESNHVIITGYTTHCHINLYGKEVPLTLKILFPEPMHVDLAPWKELLTGQTDKEITEVIASKMKAPQLDIYVDIVNQFIGMLGSSSQELVTIAQMMGLQSNHSSDIQTESICSIVQTLTRGVKIDHYIKITTDGDDKYTLHTGNISEVISQE